MLTGFVVACASGPGLRPARRRAPPAAVYRDGPDTTFGSTDVVVVVGRVGNVTFPTHSQNGRTGPGPLLHSAAAGMVHVAPQVCGGVSWFVAEQNDDPGANGDTSAKADARIMPALQTDPMRAGARYQQMRPNGSSLRSPHIGLGGLR